jgi:hypothetical protein
MYRSKRPRDSGHDLVFKVGNIEIGLSVATIIVITCLLSLLL